jgi:hypothetical protein
MSLRNKSKFSPRAAVVPRKQYPDIRYLSDARAKELMTAVMLIGYQRGQDRKRALKAVAK